MAAMPTAREMKEKFRASREAISADTMSPRAKAVRTCGGRAEGRGSEPLFLLRCSPEHPALRQNRKTRVRPSFPDAALDSPSTCTALKMAMMPVGQKQQMVVSTAMGM